MNDLESPNLIPTTHDERLREIVGQSWKIFQSHFIGERYAILKEAPFQHHFANILSTVGSLYCVSREDRFFVDLEAKCHVAGKAKFIDIVCSFSNAPARCAIELKFKTAQQAAQDHGRIDAYIDIAALEYVCKEQFNFGSFFMITDSSVYISRSKKGVGTIFCTHHKHQVIPGIPLPSTSKGREGIEIILGNPYKFHWTKFDKWYFLEIQVPQIPI
jgi:hypothetical protein